MNQIAEQLDEKLRTLEPARAQYLESLVRNAIDRVERGEWNEAAPGWPAGYFEETAAPKRRFSNRDRHDGQRNNARRGRRA